MLVYTQSTRNFIAIIEDHVLYNNLGFDLRDKKFENNDIASIGNMIIRDKYISKKLQEIKKLTGNISYNKESERILQKKHIEYVNSPSLIFFKIKLTNFIMNESIEKIIFMIESLAQTMDHLDNFYTSAGSMVTVCQMINLPNKITETWKKQVSILWKYTNGNEKPLVKMIDLLNKGTLTEAAAIEIITESLI